MAYPMIQWPTFGEVRNTLVDAFGCEYNELPDGVLAIEDGEPMPVRYFERKTNGVSKTYAVAIADDERLAPSVIRSICARLEVDPAAFGLTLG